MAETGLQENNTTIGDVTLSTTDITSNFPMKLMFSDPCSFVYLTKDDIEHPVLPQNSQCFSTKLFRYKLDGSVIESIFYRHSF